MKHPLFSAEDLAVGVLLDGKGFKEFLKSYNGEVGTESLFEGTLTKEKIIDNLLSQKIENYEKIRQNLRPDAEQGKEGVQEDNGNNRQKNQEGGSNQKVAEPSKATK